jgi:small subunit ribosomal protein S10e
MWMPAGVRRRILQSLFENGILVVSDNQAGTHPDLNCLNIYVYQLGRSFTNKGYTKKRYAWTHAYYTLTDSGVDYLRKLFGVPATVVPATYQQATPDVIADPRRERGGFRGGRGGFGRGGRDGDREGGFRGQREGGEGGGYRPPREGGEGGREAGGAWRPRGRGGGREGGFRGGPRRGDGEEAPAPQPA